MVVINQVTNMFWGITIDAGKRYSQVVNDGFNLTMAALEQGSGSQNDFVQVLLQHESSEFLLCTLQHGKLLQQPLNLVFSTGEEVSFSLNGKGVVHLTGYLLKDGPDMEDSDEDSDAPELIDSTDALLTGKKRKALAVPSESKRLKLINHAEEDSDDDDDEMDDSFSEDDLSFDEDEDDSEEDEEIDDDEDEEDEDEDIEEETPSKKKLPTQKQKPSNAASGTPKGEQQAKEKQKNQQVKKGTPTPSKEKVNAVATPGVGSTKKNKPEQKQQTPVATPATTPNTPENGESSKKKRKRNKKKKKDGNESMNESASSAPESTPKSEGKPKVEVTPKKKVMAGGTVVEDMKVGHGPEAKPGKMVSVYYVGTLAKNNKRFDSCSDGKPFRFRLNQGEVIKGWDNGINGMKVGGKRKITVPANQAYGNVRQGPIPPNSSLVFEVELKAVS